MLRASCPRGRTARNLTAGEMTVRIAGGEVKAPLAREAESRVQIHAVHHRVRIGVERERLNGCVPLPLSSKYRDGQAIVDETVEFLVVEGDVQARAIVKERPFEADLEVGGRLALQMQQRIEGRIVRGVEDADRNPRRAPGTAAVDVGQQVRG